MKSSMKSVSVDGVPLPVQVPHAELYSSFAAVGEQSRLPSWSSRPVYRGDDLPGVPLDCFTEAMIDDGSDSSYVPYDHSGLDPVVDYGSESCSGSEEEQEPMEVDAD